MTNNITAGFFLGVALALSGFVIGLMFSKSQYIMLPKDYWHCVAEKNKPCWAYVESNTKPQTIESQ